MTVHDFISRLSGVRQSGTGWAALCPAHDDDRQSLSVAEGQDKRILLNDFAGCTPEAVVAALGLSVADLMPLPESRKLKSRRNHVATYDYKDETGSLLFQVLRYAPKEFKQRRPDGKGGWIWRLDGVRRVLYRLPELLAAGPDRIVLICEGEKDADRLSALGFIATTAPGGAGKWTESYAEPLRNRRVAVLPDNDQPGQKHAASIASSIHGVAASVSLVELPGLPSKGDVSDWLEAGHTPDELERLAQDACEWSPPPIADLATLLDGLAAFVRRFVVLSAAQAIVWALWVAHTHAIDAAEQTPYLWITAPEKRCGKTRLLEVSEKVVARPWLTGRVSAAALARKVDKERPTLLLDESDAAFNGEKDYANALRGLLDTGHRVNGKASICVGQGASLDVRDFSTFCPKAIAGIGRIPDTVGDRAIPIRLQRKSRGESVNRFREKKARAEAAPLREEVESWAAANSRILVEPEPDLPEELSDRAQDGAEPLLAIADFAGGKWPEAARRALVEVYEVGNPDEDSLGERLLSDCRTVFDSRPDDDRISSAGLVQALLGLEETPWRELNRGEALTTRGLARLLNRFGILSRSIRLNDGTTPKGYLRAFFEDAWMRYCPQTSSESATPPQPNTGAGSRDFSVRHTTEPVADEKREITNSDTVCGVVADRTPPPSATEACGYHCGQLRSACERCRWPYEDHVRLSRAQPATGDLLEQA